MSSSDPVVEELTETMDGATISGDTTDSTTGNAGNTAADPEAPDTRPVLTKDSTPQEQEEYFLSNFSYIMFSKPTIDRLIEEIKLTTKNGVDQADADKAIEIAKTLYKFDYTGYTNVSMPDIVMHDEKTGEEHVGISIRFQLQLMPHDYKLEFSVPKQYHETIQKSVQFLQFGALEFSKHFITANLSAMNEIREKTKLKLDRLRFDEKTVGMYFDIPDGDQVQIKYDFYTSDKSDDADADAAESTTTNTTDSAGDMEKVD